MKGSLKDRQECRTRSPTLEQGVGTAAFEVEQTQLIAEGILGGQRMLAAADGLLFVDSCLYGVNAERFNLQIRGITGLGDEKRARAMNLPLSARF